MSINLETILALLLLSVVGGIPAAAGQNALSNTTASDIVDLVDNALSNTTASDIVDLVDNVTESEGEEEEGGGEEEEIESPLPLEAIEDLSNSPFVNDADDTSSVTTGDSTLINEVELNPRGNDLEEEWIELYNPTSVDVNISDFQISPLFQSPTIELPPDAVIEAGETYVIELDRPMLSNTGESLVLANATGDIHDRTPSLVDRSDDDRTWQRIPDGNNEWQFVENTQGNSNGDDGDDSDTGITTPDSEENTQDNANDDSDTLSTILDSVYSGSEVVEC